MYLMVGTPTDPAFAGRKLSRFVPDKIKEH